MKRELKSKHGLPYVFFEKNTANCRHTLYIKLILKFQKGNPLLVANYINYCASLNTLLYKFLELTKHWTSSICYALTSRFWSFLVKKKRQTKAIMKKILPPYVSLYKASK